ncbi:hypothetical protein GCM10029963_50760 [Micromonospora andamanensis]
MRRFLTSLLALAVLVPLAPASSAASAAPSTAVPDPAPPQPPQAAPLAPDRVLDPDRRLGKSWRRSADRVMTTSADETGLHILVADADAAYQWRTVTTLAEPGVATDQWVGQACLTGSGRTAVAVYAPRQFTNRETLSNAGAFAAVVNLETGRVSKLPERYSLAYHNPGCGSGESVVLTRLELPATPEAGAAARTVLTTLDTRRIGSGRQVITPGQVTSAIPVGQTIVAAKGDELVSLDRRGRLTTRARTAGTPSGCCPTVPATSHSRWLGPAPPTWSATREAS